MRLKYALIGCGRISPNHIVAASQSGVEIVALCDTDEKIMETRMLQFELPSSVQRFTDYQQMLETARPDLVAICTPSGTHGTIALDCLEAGAHLIIEKPLTLSLAEADAIMQRAKVNTRLVTVCHQNRFNKSVQKIREALEKGRFGKLYYGTANIRWTRDYEYYARASWRGSWEQDGGALMNQCIHNIDLLRWMMGGAITEVYGMTDQLKHDYIEAEDFGSALVRFGEGGYGIIEGTTNVYPENLEETLCLFGEKGTVKVGGQSLNIIEEWRFSDMLDNAEQVKATFRETPPNVYGYGHAPLYADMVDAIAKGRDPYVTARDGKDAVELVLAIYASAAGGKPVALPLKEGKTIDSQGRFGEGLLYPRKQYR